MENLKDKLRKTVNDWNSLFSSGTSGFANSSVDYMYSETKGRCDMLLELIREEEPDYPTPYLFCDSVRF